MMEFNPISAPTSVLTAADRRIVLETGWLSQCSPGFQREILSLAAIREFAENEVLYRYGDPAEALYAVVSGAVRVAVPADDGQEFVVHRDEVGFWVGDLAMLSRQTRLVTVSATQPTRTLCVPAARILEMVRRDPANFREFYALSHENTRIALRIAANLAVTGTRQRIALRLLHITERRTDKSGWISISQAELAAMVAVSPATLQRELRRLVEGGIVELGYGRLRVLDRTRLASAAQT